VGALAAAGAWLLRTDGGIGTLRRSLESRLSARLTDGAALRIGSLSRADDGAWVVGNLAVADAKGRSLLAIGEARFALSVGDALRRRVHLGVVSLRGVRVSLIQSRDGAWNTDGLVRPSGGGSGGPAPLVTADSIALEDAAIMISARDTSAALPNVERSLRELALALGPTTLSSPDSSGGWTVLRQLGAQVSLPPVHVTGASGPIRWWPDSLSLTLDQFTLPATHASARGRVSWPRGQPVQMDIAIRADSAAVADIRWASALIPPRGTASADLRIRGTGSEFVYDVERFSLASATSRVRGSFRVRAGRSVAAESLRLSFDPLGMDVLRDILGDSVIAPPWAGALTGTVSGRGGPLDAIAIDSVALEYADARIGGARSQLSAHGVVDASGPKSRLTPFNVRFSPLDIRTLGVIVAAADSMRGTLGGEVTLEGPTDNLLFRELVAVHRDGALARSQVRGSGRLAADLASQWLEADLTIDTLAIGTVAAPFTTAPLRGFLRGALALRATGDTLSLDARLAGEGMRVRLAGNTLLDSTRTTMQLAGRLDSLDLSRFVARADIPGMQLSGALSVAIDDAAAGSDRHIQVALDSTSRLGGSAIRGGALRLGLDSTGIHLDTLDLTADTWQVEARGRLPRAVGAAGNPDSILFALRVDSLDALRTIVLDSTGAPLITGLAGRARVAAGTITGSFESATVVADVGIEDLAADGVRVRRAIGTVRVADLPDSATGIIRATLDSLMSGSARLDRAAIQADLRRGHSARVTLRGTTADSIALSGSADVTWPDQGYRIAVDSFAATVGPHAWTLERAANLSVATGVVTADTIRLTSNAGASVQVGGRFDDAGPVSGFLRANRVSVAEFAFTGALPPGLSGTLAAEASLGGTRAAPKFNARLEIDSVATNNPDAQSRRAIQGNGREAAAGAASRSRARLVLDAAYEDRRLAITSAGDVSGRRVLDLGARLPLNLSLDSVPDRIVDEPMTLRLRLDRLLLADFDGLADGISALGGRLDADLDVGGTIRRPRGRGTLTMSDGAMVHDNLGLDLRDATALLTLSGDSVIVNRMRVTDSQSQTDTASLQGVVRLSGTKWTEWTANLRSAASQFRAIDDPRLATAEASWDLSIAGPLAAPTVTGAVTLPYAVFTIGPQRRARGLRGPRTERSSPLGTPQANGVLVTLGNDVRLKSREANVQLTGAVELFGPLDFPWVSGSVSAARGTYRVDLGVIKRTFVVDSGSVILEGTPDIPAALDIHTSYTVRRPDNDVKVGARVYGTTLRPRLNLTSDLGSAVPQSEIISYLVFGRPSFGVNDSRQSAAQSVTQSATAAVVPSLGGLLESTLGTLLPFFSTMQVSTVAGEGPENIMANPLDGLLNSVAVTGGRQVGTDTFFSVSGGVCRAGRTSSSSNVPFWLGTLIEYRPKRTLGASIAIDPGVAPCSRAGSFGDTYQFGLDLSYDWKFGGPRKP